jgi:hypothetical protein
VALIFLKTGRRIKPSHNRHEQMRFLHGWKHGRTGGDAEKRYREKTCLESRNPVY